MGFFGNLLSGGAGFAGANNAHLAELVIKRLTTSEKKRVAEKVVDMGMSAGGHRMNTEQFKDFFNDRDRLCQLNVIALALAHLDIDPNIAGESWMLVNHPFALPTDSNDLQTNASHFRRKHNLSVSVGTDRIDIRKWAADEEIFAPSASGGNEIQQIKAMAENGNADAQGALGLAYHYGEGVHQDSVQAAYWFRKSADQGNAVAQSMLENYATSAPKITALQQAQNLATNGDAHWQYKLGVMYAYGQDVTQDYQEALKWFRLSATQGSAEAQSDLGAMYQGGFGVDEDHVQSMMWYLIAKANGSTLPDQNLHQLESLSTPAQIAEAQRMAREWSAAHHSAN